MNRLDSRLHFFKTAKVSLYIVAMISKESFISSDVVTSKCLHATSSNAPLCMHYVDGGNYCSLTTVMFPLGSMGKRLRYFRRSLIIENNKIKFRMD